MLRFASLGSGSRGNATLVQSAETLLLIDCGFPLREFAGRCAGLGVAPEDIDALLLTHEHGDHVRGAGPLARRHQVPVWSSHGTWRSWGRKEKDIDWRELNGHDRPFHIGDIEISPFAVPHDAREPCQFVLAVNDRRLGLLTDLGSITPRVLNALNGVDALLLECNHDADMLWSGPYPPSLRRRVGGTHGHLSNAQAAELLAELDQERLQHLVAGHLSEKNNRPELARNALLDAAPEVENRLTLLDQDRPSVWFELDAISRDSAPEVSRQHAC